MSDTTTAPTDTATPPPSDAPKPKTPAELIKKLIDAGIHFGHPASRWDPKMKPYIYGKRGNIHIIDVKETLKGLIRAKRLVQNAAAKGQEILLVGTKRQARDIIAEHADRAGMHYVSERWLGGTLTNFRTIRARLNRLDELDALWESGEIETYSKKMKSTLSRERTKIKTNLEGIRNMEKMPSIMFIIDTRREKIAVKEAQKLGLTTIALIDTDSDPDLVDLPIPGNDDAMKAIEVIVEELADAAVEGAKMKPAQPEKGEHGARGEKPKGRSHRARFKSDDQAKPSDTAGPAEDAALGRSVKIGDGAPVEPAGTDKATVGLPTEKLSS